MTKEELKRESLAVLDFSEGTALCSLAAEAESVLGYKVLASVAEKQEKKLGILAKALGTLEIQPFRDEDVKAYCAERRTAANLAALQEFLARADCANDSYFSLDWRKEKISEYRLPVPEFVLNKAVQIKKACPEAELWIESLKRDPFLVVTIPDSSNSWASPLEEFYIEVWDEPKFEGRM
jgi:hypothetical protein